MKYEFKAPRMLERLAHVADKIRNELRDPTGATAEQTAKDTERCRAAFAAPYTMNEAEVTSFAEIAQAARELKKATAQKIPGEGGKQESAALDRLFSLLEEVETRLPAKEVPYVLLGADAASLAEVVRAAHGLRYTYFDDSKSSQDFAQGYLFSALEKVKFRLPSTGASNA